MVRMAFEILSHAVSGLSMYPDRTRRADDRASCRPTDARRRRCRDRRRTGRYRPDSCPSAVGQKEGGWKGIAIDGTCILLHCLTRSTSAIHSVVVARLEKRWELWNASAEWIFKVGRHSLVDGAHARIAGSRSMNAQNGLLSEGGGGRHYYPATSEIIFLGTLTLVPTMLVISAQSACRPPLCQPV